MIKHVLTCFVLFLAGGAVTTFGGEKKQHEMQIAPPVDLIAAEKPAGDVRLPDPMVLRPTGSMVIGTTTYDYGWNSGYPQYIAHYDGITYMTYMNRFGAGNAFREVGYVTYDGTTLTMRGPVIPSTQIAVTGFHSIDVWRGGLAAGFAGVGVSAGLATGSLYALESGPAQGNFVSSSMTPNADVNILHVDTDGTVLSYDTRGRGAATGATPGRYRIRKSTDFGNQFVTVNEGVDSTTALPGGQYYNSLDSPLFKWPNGDVGLGVTLTGRLASTHAPPVGSSPPDSARLIGYFRSTNQGTTWTWNTIAYSGQQLLPTHYYLPANFSQAAFNVDVNGRIRTAFNGYNFHQYAPHPDSLRSSIDLVYWDPVNGFKSLVNFDRTLTILNDVINLRANNALGCSYPAMGVSDDGMCIVVTWSQPNFTPTSVDTVGGFIKYDMYYNVSFDGGATWQGATPLTTTGDRYELFGNMASNLTPVPGGYRARMIYLSDSRPGMSVFTCPTCEDVEEWMYHDFDVFPTSVGDGTPGIPTEFVLHQNFPNPFNPTTVIGYTLPEASSVKLSVYDVLGQEVATVVEDFKPAGSHTVDFSARTLASGVYYYTLTAGKYSATKKMVVMK